MKLLKEFSYTDIFQRRIIFVNIFLTFSVLSIIYSDIAVSYNFYFPYRHVFREIVLYFTIGIFIGNITGKGLFRLAQYRVVYILSEIFFFAVSLLFFLQNFLFILPEQVMRDYLICNMHVLPLLLGILPFFTGIKLNYFLKITCGNFIDDKKGTLTFLTSILTGFISGIVLYGAVHYFIDNIHFAAALLLPIFFTTFIIRLMYNSSTQYAQDIEEPDDVKEMQTGVRDDIYFTFLNFTYVIIYVFLGYEIVVKHVGNFLHVQLLFVLSLVVSVLIGFGIARYLRNAFWYVYSEMIFPLLFLSFLILVSLYGNTFQYASIVFFIIPSVMFGFSAYKTINNILLQYDHNKRFNIIDLSLLILPVPIFVSLLHLRFTNMWFYIFLYVVMILNVALPGIHLMQREIQSYKKILYIFFSIIFIPAIIFVHAYFKIPFDDTVFIRHIKGFNQIYDKNYNSMYIQNPVDVSLHNYVIFNNTDSALRNLKRALVPVYMYASYSENKKNVLFIDGYQKFFQNPLIAYFKQYKVIDYIPEERVDYNRLPLSGRKSYMVDACDTVKYLTKGESTYSIIVDIPNLFDQKMNTLKYSQVYYSLVKSRLEKHGIFAQLFDLNSLSRQKIAMSRNNMKKIFPNTVGYLFSNILLVMASDRSETFSITPLHLKAVSDLFTEMTESVYMFFNEEHMVSHLIFTEYSDYFSEMKDVTEENQYIPVREKSIILRSTIEESYFQNNEKILQLIPDERENVYFKMNLKNSIARNSEIFSMLKEAEFNIIEKDFIKESEILMKLYVYSAYRPDLRKYLEKILEFKERFYYDTAVQLEKDKKWESAKNLYQAILTINKNNFDANYRIGLLCLTLQQVNESFEYMQNAMKLKKDDPRVQYQMGVLLFSSGKAKEAMQYFQYSIDLNNDSAQVFFYLGLSYEETGRIIEAKSSYEKAALKDPNDSDIQLSLERINKKIEDERNRWRQKDPENQNEEETGERVPLPVNKSAYEWRITDEEAKKMKP